MKRVAITGPECTGKTTLARQLAEHFETQWVPEYAREYLSQHGTEYRHEDILKIAMKQLELETKMTVLANEILFCDTCLLVCKVWSEVRFGRVDAWIVSQIHDHPYDLYIMPLPDFPWVGDPLRENPNDRWDLLERYRGELRRLGRRWIEVSGSEKQRLSVAVAAVESLV